MRPSDYHLLQLVRCLSYLGNKDEHVAETIIRRDDVRRINGMSAQLAYDLNVSEHGLRLVRHGDFDPIAKILWACSQCVNDVPTLERCLHANREVSFTSPSQMMNGTGVSFYDFKRMLSKHEPIPVRLVRQVASNIHAPKMSIIKTFKRSGLKVYDPVRDLPVLARHVNPRIALKNYIKTLASAHDMSMNDLSVQLGYKYSSLVRIIKQDPESKVVHSFRKLPEIFQGISLHVITEIMHDDGRPRMGLMKRALEQIHDRRSLMNFITLSARLFGVTINDLAKTLGKSSNSLRMFTMECSSVQLCSIIAKIAHILAFPHWLAGLSIKTARSIADRVPLPKRLTFNVDYYEWPFSYADNYSAKVRQSALNAKSSDLKSALSSDNNKLARHDIRTIVGIWSEQFGFSEAKFLKQNFDADQEHINLCQSTRKYPLHSYDWKRILTVIYKQLAYVHDAKNPSSLPTQVAKRVRIDGDQLSEIIALNRVAESLMDHQKHVFTGKFVHTGVRTIKTTDPKRKEYYRPVIVFNNIRLDHKLILDRAVFNYTKVFVNLGHLWPGDLIKTKAMVYKDDNGYNLYRPNWVKLIRRAHQRDDTPVPSEIHALTGFAIENNKSGVYDFTTWGHNYGYVRYCEQRYKQWKQEQKHRKEGAKHAQD